MEDQSPKSSHSGQLNTRLAMFVAAMLVAVGALFRVGRYLYDAPLRLDEALLAYNVVHVSWVDLVKPLTWHQNSPFAFLYTSKLMVSLFGPGEMVFRAVPLMSGLASLILFYVFVRRMSRPSEIGLEESKRDSIWIPGVWSRERWDVVLVALSLFVIGKWLIYWSSEFRHYSTDVALTCLLYLMALRVLSCDENMGPLRRFAPILITGAICTWFSLASIFILGGIGATLLGHYALQKKWTWAGWSIALCIVWLLSFYAQLKVHEFNIEARALESDISATVGKLGFIWSLTDFKWYRETFELVFWLPGGLTHRGMAGFAFLLGCISYWKDKRLQLSFLLLPIVFGLMAAYLHRYPFWERYLLYLTPVMFLLMAEGVGLLFAQRTWQMRVAGLLFIGMLLMQPWYRGVRDFVRPYGENEIHDLVAYAKENWQEGDLLYMDWFEVAPYSFYRDTHADYQFFPEADVELEPHFCEAVKDNEQFRAVYRGERIPELFKDYKRIWLFHGHDGAPLYSGVDEPVALEAEKHQSSGLALHLLVPREP